MAVEAAAPTSRRTRSSSTSSSSTAATSHPSQSASRTPRRPPPQSPRERLTFTSSAATAAAAAAASSSSSFYSDPSSSANYTGNNTATSSSLSSRTSLSSLRDSLSQNPHIYDISEIRRATNNFLAKTYSSSSSCWRCNLRGTTDAIVFQRKFRRKIETDRLKELLSVICRSNHVTVVKLLGASISGDYIYLVYEFVKGANLADCLRNARNPEFTVLSSWISRIQIAADLAHALDYVHNKTGLNMTLVHNHFTSSSVIVTEASLNAKICHFGTAQLCGEVDDGAGKPNSEITTVPEGEEGRSSSKLTRSDSAGMQFQGVRGYMSPEFRSTGIATQKSDVYAFGVVILELLSGEESMKYKFDKSVGNYVRTTLIETATAALTSAAVGGGGDGGLRKWVDRRLKDSFPVDVAERLVRIALDCVHVEADKRPDMARVAGKISRLYIDSVKWNDSMRMPTDQISVSLAAR
ncbi:LysM domain receptor-like kinase 3 [Linum perenne]